MATSSGLRFSAGAMLVAGALVACDFTPGFDYRIGAVHIKVDSPVFTNYVTNAAIQNQSGSVLQVGPIPCQVFRDKLEATGWQAIGQSAALCRQQTFTIAAGESYEFQFLAPERGEYRLRMIVAPDTILSEPFTVH